MATTDKHFLHSSSIMANQHPSATKYDNAAVAEHPNRQWQ